MRYGFHPGRIDWTRDISHGSTSKTRGSNMSGCTLVGWLGLGPSYSSQDVVLSGFLPAWFTALLRVVSATNEHETATHAWMGK